MLATPPTTVVPATWELTGAQIETRATRGQLKTSVSEYPKLVEWVYKDYDQKRVT